MRNKLLVGSDIELMPASIQSNQENFSWWMQWLATVSSLPPKGERLNLGNGYWMHRDGFSVEFGIPPSSTVDEFLEHMRNGKRAVETHFDMPMIGIDWFDVSIPASTPGFEDYLQMGCSPDFQVIGASGECVERAIPDDARDESIRECGGHIHISLPDDMCTDMAMRGVFIRHLDDVVYPMFNMNLGDYRSWYRHRRLFRPTSYGVEYRSLGASTLFDDHLTEVYVKQLFSVVNSVWGK